VTAHPRTALAIALAALVALAAPILDMRTASPGSRDLPASTPASVALRTIDRAFPGAYETAQLVVSGHGLGSARARSALARLGAEGRRITGTDNPVTIRVARDGATALVAVPAREASLTGARDTVERLRGQLKPATARLLPGATAALTGDAAADVDFTNRLSTVTPLVIAFVLVLAFVLLVAAFGSPRLALSVIGLNLLSVGAAFGVLVAVFEHRWAQSLLHFRSDGAVVNWLPLFAFVVLFGLSMDYTVLILERAREARRDGASAREAAAQALGQTGATVTSAALVMVAVFAIFATLPLLEFKQLGIGLATAIALDATIVRGLALPAAVALLGDRGLAPARRPRRADPRWDHQPRGAALETTHE
jgi:RND superfamily putative drug exporter